MKESSRGSVFRTYKSRLNSKELKRLFIEQMQPDPTYYLCKVIGYQVGLDVVIKEAGLNIYYLL